MSILQIILTAAGTAALFILFAVLRPASRECSGDCTACVTGSCSTDRGRS